MPDAIIYIRFSTGPQERGDSRRRQYDDCLAYCTTHGLHVSEVVEDLGRSAYKGDHLSVGNLGKLTARIVRGEIASGTTIVVEKMDRLSREKPRIIRRWIEDVCDNGLKIARVSGGPVIDAAYLDDGSNLAAVIDMAYSNNAAHEFSQNISDRLSSSWVQRRKNAGEGRSLLTASTPRWIKTEGEWGGKNSPDHRRFVLVPDRAAIVLRIYELAADGMGSWGIAKYLNANQFANWGKTSTSSTQDGWNHTTVLNILNSPAVEGIHYPTHQVGRKRVRTGEVYRDYFPIIDGLTADLVARARSQMTKRAGGGPRSNNGRNLLASLAKCGTCQGYMVLRSRGAAEGPFAYLQCDNAAKGKGCADKGMFNYRVLEPAILDAVLHHTLDNAFFSVANRATDLRIQLAELDRQIEIVRGDRDSARALYIRHPEATEFETDWQALSSRTRELETDRAQMAVQLSEAAGEISAADHLKRVHNFRAALYDEDEEVRRTARLRVRDSFRSVLTHVVCEQRDGDKRLQIAIENGVVVVTFDNTGKVIDRQDFRDSPDHISGLTSGVMAERRPAVDALLRRSDKAL
jgi:DNA invertase Pin-like site-specific DNA recombinase